MNRETLLSIQSIEIGFPDFIQLNQRGPIDNPSWQWVPTDSFHINQYVKYEIEIIMTPIHGQLRTANWKATFS